jgi:hypothetical protein
MLNQNANRDTTVLESLPIYFIFGRLLNVRPHWPPAEIQATNWTDLVTIVPATIGVLIGSGFRGASALVMSR